MRRGVWRINERSTEEIVDSIGNTAGVESGCSANGLERNRKMATGIILGVFGFYTCGIADGIHDFPSTVTHFIAGYAPLHGENRGSIPLGCANKINCLRPVLRDERDLYGKYTE